MERYRLFLEKGNYDVSVGNSRFEALEGYQKRGKDLSVVVGICLIKGNGNQRIFKVSK